MSPAWAYLQVRLQARLGQCLPSEAWKAMESIEATEAFFDEVRRTPLAPWIAGLTARSGIHEVEQALKKGLRRHIREVAAWMPRAWRFGVIWLARLIDLPAVYHLMEGREVYPWMREDESLRPFLEGDAGARRRAFLSSDLAVFFQAYERGTPLLEAWKEAWMERLPSFPPSLKALVSEVEEHLRTFPALSPEEAWVAREAFLERFILTFRRASLQPTLAFAYLGGVALTLERLRGNMVRRL